MSVDVIVGGQGGDEGKGKIAAWLSLHKHYSICIRVSGPNAGHSITYKGKRLGLATIPCGFVNEKLRVLIGRGAFISIDKTFQNNIFAEIEKTNLTPGRLGIDEYATIITEKQRQEEIKSEYSMKKIGSVGTGLGISRINKIKRGKEEPVVFAKDIPELKDYITNTTDEIFEALSQEGKILLEGDQGFKLSLIHGEFPYVTSRDTTASTFLGEAGIGPKNVRDVYIVFKPYVTRVAPGPLENEIFDEQELNWAHNEGGETGTVSGRLRRMGEFEWDKAVEATQINSANKICLTHMDYFGKYENRKFPNKAIEFLQEVKKRICYEYPLQRISLISYGPDIEDVIEWGPEWKERKW